MTNQQMTKYLQSELSKAYCVADAAWDLFCRHPTQETWDLYEAEKQKETTLSESIEARNKAMAAAAERMVASKPAALCPELVEGEGLAAEAVGR
jgi:fructosamine-3-kinase